MKKRYIGKSKDRKKRTEKKPPVRVPPGGISGAETKAFLGEKATSLWTSREEEGKKAGAKKKSGNSQAARFRSTWRGPAQPSGETRGEKGEFTSRTNFRPKKGRRGGLTVCNENRRSPRRARGVVKGRRLRGKELAGGGVLKTDSRANVRENCERKGENTKKVANAWTTT